MILEMNMKLVVAYKIVWISLKQNMSTVFFYLNNVNNFIDPNMLFNNINNEKQILKKIGGLQPVVFRHWNT